MAEQPDAFALLSRIDETRAMLRDLVLSADARALADRPPSDQWSIVENVRHLVFAEQLHLGKFISETPAWSAVGLTPHFLAGESAFRDVGTKPTTLIHEVLDAWDAVHAPLRDIVAEANDDACKALQRNLAHLQHHAAVIDSLIRERA